MTTPRRVTFGPFELDAAGRVLYRDDRPVALTPKQVHTLVVLVRDAGQVVDRDQLMREVWPDTFVEDAGLTRNISALRKALGDGPEGGTYIETVPKRGYRFVASLGGDEHPAASANPRAPRPAWVAAVVTLVVLITAGGGWLMRPDPPPSGTPQTIAVLPFRLMSADLGDQFLAFGLADLLTTRLGSLKTLMVRPMPPASAPPVADPVEAGRQLGVDAVIDGTVRREGDRLRLTVQVIDVASGAPLYAGTFDERGEDVIALESALADGVFSLLMPRVLDGERAGRARAGTANTSALEQYLLGRYLLATRDPTRVEEAIAAFTAAADADPAFALAHAGLAHALVVQGGYQYRWPAEVFPKARIAALRALDLDPRMADAYGALGESAWQYDWDWAATEQAQRQALDLAPNDPTLRQWRAYFLSAMGRSDEALAEIERAVQLAPRDFAVNLTRAALHYWSHRFEDATVYADRAAALGGHAPVALLYKHFALYRLGRFDEARAAFETVRGILPDEPIVQNIAAVYHWRDGQPDRARTGLAQIEALRQGGRFVDAFLLAATYAEIGDADRAFIWLDQAISDRSAYVPMLVVDPTWAYLHEDPRFVRAVQRVGLTPVLTRVKGQRVE